MRSPAFAGVVLAAGASLRMGQDKALLQYAGRSFLAGAIQLLKGACDFVIVVAGNNTDLLRPVVYQSSGFIIRNPNPEMGQFGSLRLALQAVLNRGRDAACVTVVDRPPAQAATLAKLKNEFLRTVAEGTWAVVPQFNGKHGHPVVFGREMFEEFLRADPSSNARDVEHQNQSRVHYVEVDDPRVTMNINTPEDYATLLQTTS